jgi:hypothetical protein
MPRVCRDANKLVLLPLERDLRVSGRYNSASCLHRVFGELNGELGCEGYARRA